MPRIPLLVATLLIIPVAFAAHGGTPVGRCGGGVGMIELTDGTATGTFYLDERGPTFTYLYEESNRVWFQKLPGAYAGSVVGHDLQRGGTGLAGKDNCVDVGEFDPDTLHY